MQEEVWLPIEHYEGVYEVSSYGRVRSLDRVIEKSGNRNSTYLHKIKGRILKPKLTKFGYYEHGLSNGERRNMSYFRINRLVAQAFIPNPDNLPQVHHKDHDKLNNHVDNLKWVTGSENIKEAITAGKHHGGFKKGLKHHRGKLSDEQVLEIRDLIKTKRNYEIANIFGISRGHVTDLVKGNKRKIKAELETA